MVNILDDGDEIALAGLDPANVEKCVFGSSRLHFFGPGNTKLIRMFPLDRFTAMGFPQSQVILVLKAVNYRGRVTSLQESEALERLLS